MKNLHRLYLALSMLVVSGLILSGCAKKAEAPADLPIVGPNQTVTADSVINPS